MLFNYSDGVTKYFGYGNVLSSPSAFKSYFSQHNLKVTYTELTKGGEYIKTPKRKIAVYCYGATITAAEYPKYIDDDGNHHLLPRPYEKCKPGGCGFELMMSSWFKSFVQSVEKSVISFLTNFHEDKVEANKILVLMDKCRTVVPYELRVGGSCFTHMSVIGRLQDQGEVPMHFDEKDYITALVHLGNVKTGGSTQYFNGVSVKNHGHVAKVIPFAHGQIQIGCYNKILHAGEEWTGSRGCINFNLKKIIIDHFVSVGNKYYNQYRKNKFPKGIFYAT